MNIERYTKFLTKDKTTNGIEGALADDYFQDDYFQPLYFQTGTLNVSGNTATDTISLNLNRTTLKLL